MNDLATGLAVRFGKRKQLIGVNDLAEASVVVNRFTDAFIKAGKGVSSWPRVEIYDVATMKPIGKASWNGKIWPMAEWFPGQKPLYPEVAA